MILMKNLLGIFIFLYSLSAFGQQDNLQKKAVSLLNSVVEENISVGIAAGFSVAGEVKWQGGEGYSDIGSKTVFTPLTLNRIASIAKPLTAVAILQLYESKKIDLDIAIQTYLPDFPVKPEGDITIRQLLGHSSGLDDYKSKKEQENKIHYASLADVISIFQDRDLIAIPGKEFHYTTYGYVVLGRIIEEVSGMKYDQYIQRYILDPLEMKNTGVEYIDTLYLNKASLYHRNTKGKISAADLHDLSNRVPGGGFYSNVGDMLKFGDAILQNTLINATTRDLMFTNAGLKKEGNGYGMGWYLYGENPNYGPVYGHNGAQTGASTFLMLLPDQQTSIIVLSNTSGTMQQVSNIIIALFDVAAGYRP